jgi:hypothetical protein
MTTKARPLTTTAKLLLTCGVVAAALGAVAVRPAVAAPASAKHSAGPCWLRIVNDWIPDGKITGSYPLPCYQQAINHLAAYPDLQGYSSAIDDIRAARTKAIKDKKEGITPGTTTGDNGTGTSTNPGPAGPGGKGGGPGSGKSFLERLGDRLGPGNAQSIPLPLLVLGGLALLLLLAALATWLARRIQARRVTPAPAPAPRR